MEACAPSYITPVVSVGFIRIPQRCLPTMKLHQRLQGYQELPMPPVGPSFHVVQRMNTKPGSFLPDVQLLLQPTSIERAQRACHSTAAC